MDNKIILEKYIEKLTLIFGEIENKTHAGEMGKLPMRSIVYLSLIEKLENPTITNIADKLNVTKPTVTISINKLFRDGYVKKLQSSEELRVFYLSLTEKGRQYNEMHYSTHREFAKLITECLNESEVVQLVNILDKVFNRLD